MSALVIILSGKRRAHIRTYADSTLCSEIGCEIDLQFIMVQNVKTPEMVKSAPAPKTFLTEILKCHEKKYNFSILVVVNLLDIYPSVYGM